MPYPAADSIKGHCFHLIPFVWIGELSNFALSPRTYPPQFDLVRLVRFNKLYYFTALLSMLIRSSHNDWERESRDQARMNHNQGLGS